MLRYYLDVIGDERFLDTEGVEFSDAATMRKQAMRAAGAMVAEATDFPSTPWRMVVRDDERQIIATLSFSARAP